MTRPVASHRLSRAVLIERLPGYVGQVVLLALVAWLAWRGCANFLGNARALGVSAGFAFLHAEAGFQIAQSMIAFSPASSYLDAAIVATLNTLLVVALASLLSTVIGLCIAFGRLAAHPLIRGASSAWVEVFRNIPLLLQIFFWYFSAMALLPGVGDSLQLGAVLLNNRGLFLPRVQATAAGAWAIVAALAAFAALFMAARRALASKAAAGPAALALVAAALAVVCLAPLSLLHVPFGLDRPRVEGFNVAGGFALLPELMALTLGLSIYNSTFLAEIFRAGILSVPRGQIEAAASVGLSGVRAALLVTLPQALRVAIPPTVGFSVNLIKSTSLAAIIGFVELTRAGQLLNNATFRPFLIFGTVAAIYFVLCWPLTLAATGLEKRLAAAYRR